MDCWQRQVSKAHLCVAGMLGGGGLGPKEPGTEATRTCHAARGPACCFLASNALLQRGSASWQSRKHGHLTQTLDGEVSARVSLMEMLPVKLVQAVITLQRKGIFCLLQVDGLFSLPKCQSLNVPKSQCLEELSGDSELSERLLSLSLSGPPCLPQHVISKSTVVTCCSHLQDTKVGFHLGHV